MHDVLDFPSCGRQLICSILCKGLQAFCKFRSIIQWLKHLCDLQRSCLSSSQVVLFGMSSFSRQHRVLNASVPSLRYFCKTTSYLGKLQAGKHVGAAISMPRVLLEFKPHTLPKPSAQTCELSYPLLGASPLDPQNSLLKCQTHPSIPERPVTAKSISSQVL